MKVRRAGKRFVCVGADLGLAQPTIVTMPPSSVNQIPGQVTLSGDVRLTPFYNVGEAKRIIEGYFRGA
jgi:hypothetical protein